MTLSRLAPVDEELTEAIRYYNAINDSLGTRLFDEFVVAIG